MSRGWVVSFVLCGWLASGGLWECLVNDRFLETAQSASVLGHYSVFESAWSVLGPLVMLEAVQGVSDEG